MSRCRAARRQEGAAEAEEPAAQAAAMHKKAAAAGAAAAWLPPQVVQGQVAVPRLSAVGSHTMLPMAASTAVMRVPKARFTSSPLPWTVCV